MVETTSILTLHGREGPEIYANRCATKVAWKEPGILENFYIINPGDWARKTDRAPFTHLDDLDKVQKIRNAVYYLFPHKRQGEIWGLCRESINKVGINRLSKIKRQYESLGLPVPPPPQPPGRYAFEFQQHNARKAAEKEAMLQHARQLAARLQEIREGNQVGSSQQNELIPGQH